MSSVKIPIVKKGKNMLVADFSGYTVELCGETFNGSVGVERLLPKTVIRLIKNNRSKHFIVEKITRDSIILEMVTKSYYEDFCEKYRRDSVASYATLLQMFLRQLSNLEKNDVKRSTIETYSKQLNEAIKKRKDIEAKIESLRKELQKHERFTDKEIEEIANTLKEFVMKFGVQTRENRWEFEEGYDRLSDRPKVLIVLDKDKGMFYVKVLSYYLYFEKEGEKKVSGNIDDWSKALNTILSTKSAERPDLSKQRKELELLIKASEENIGNEFNKMIAPIVKKIGVKEFDKFRYTFDLDNYEKILSEQKKLPKEVIEALKRFNQIRRIGITLYPDKIRYEVGHTDYWNKMPLSLYPIFIEELKASLVIKNYVANMVLNSMETAMKDIEKLSIEYNKNLEKMKSKLDEVSSRFFETFKDAVKKMSYGYRIDVKGYRFGFSNNGKLEFISKDRTYYYSSDKATLGSIRNAVSIMLSVLNSARQ